MNALSGHLIHQSAELNAALDRVLDLTIQYEAGLGRPRPAQPEQLEHGERTFKAAASARGRPLNYPYIGTGAGRGAYVELEDGSVKLDLINGIGVHIFGHGHREIRKAALMGALSDVVMQGNLQPNIEYVALSEKLVQLASRRSRLKYCWFSTCGSMANENALKIARQKNSPAKYVIAMKNAFAGRSTMMAEVTDNPAYKEGLPEYGEVLRIPWYDANDPRSSENVLRAFQQHCAKFEKQIAAFVFEPMLGEGGYRTAPRSFFVPLLEFCRAQGIAVWADEVQTFMRTGEFFAFETLCLGEYIDICTVAKTLQTGATLYTEAYNPKPGLIAGTFSGSSSSLQAGLKAVDLLENGGFLGNEGRIRALHRKFVGMLEELNGSECKGQLRDAGGMGLMIAVTPLDGSKEKVNQLLQVLFRNGLIAFSCGRDPYRLRFLLPAIMTDEDIDVAREILSRSIRELLT